VEVSIFFHKRWKVQRQAKVIIKRIV